MNRGQLKNTEFEKNHAPNYTARKEQPFDERRDETVCQV